MCATCIYKPDSPLNLKKLEDDIRDPYVGFTTFRTCHHSDDVCCRGFWEAHSNEFQLGQVAQRLNMVEFVEVDTLKDKQSIPDDSTIDLSGLPPALINELSPELRMRARGETVPQPEPRPRIRSMKSGDVGKEARETVAYLRGYFQGNQGLPGGTKMYKLGSCTRTEWDRGYRDGVLARRIDEMSTSSIYLQIVKRFETLRKEKAQTPSESYTQRRLREIREAQA